MLLTSLLTRYITIAFCVIGFAVLASFPGRHKEEGPDDEEQDVKPFPLKWMSYGAMACASLAAILSFVAAFWQHLSSSTVVTMAEALTYGVVGGRVGTVAMVLGWGCAGFTALTFLGLLIMILTLRALDRITA